MKTIIIFILTIVSSHISFSQLTMTNQYNPVVGDIDSYAICDTANITQGSSGANQVWSFLNLVKIDTSDVHFVTSASTPYSGQFASSNIASTNDSSLRQLFYFFCLKHSFQWQRSARIGSIIHKPPAIYAVPLLI